MSTAFKAGDVVELKSGGPKMTVAYQHGGGALQCNWFDGSTKKAGSFNPDMLKLVDQDEPATK